MTTPNRVVEQAFTAARSHRRPFRDVQLDVLVTDPSGAERRVPAFWAGERQWKLRYSSPQPGEHRWRSICSEHDDTGLHDVLGSFEVVPNADEANALYRHGAPVVAEGGRHFQFADGDPFLWLADTWWMGLAARLAWPDGFTALATDRRSKGFNVVQIVAGLYPDMPPFDQRGANEAGFPWDSQFETVNPAYFDAADQKIAALVAHELVPLIVGAWGFYMQFAGEDVMRRHWRYLVARWGAYPVAWCVAGEALMAYYDSEVWDQIYEAELRGHGDGLGGATVQRHRQAARACWSRVSRYVRDIDPFGRIVTIHPGSRGRWSVDQVEDPALIDFDLTQCGLHDLLTFPQVIDELTRELEREPIMPRLVGETCYEGEGGWNWENVQRLLFWGSVLNGTAGHTYGATGIWQVNTRDTPFGHDPRPFGESFDEVAWDDAMHFAGSGQVGLGKQLLERYRWWLMRPHPDWVRAVGGEKFEPLARHIRPYTAGIPRELRITFIPVRILVTMVALEADVVYEALYFDPRTGRAHPVGRVGGDTQGEWQPPKPPIIQDWVLVMSASAQPRRGSAQTDPQQ